MHSTKALGALLMGALVWAVSAPVAAKGLSYSYADVGYQRTDLDAPDDTVDIDAGEVEVSFGIAEYVALRGGFLRGRIDYPGESTDITEFRVGARGHFSLMKALDIYAEGLFFNSKYNGSGDGVSSTTDTGGIYEGGFRLKAHKKAEINLAYRYKSGEWDESYIVPGGVIMITKKLGISVNAAFGDDDNEEYFAGVRIKF